MIDGPKTWAALLLSAAVLLAACSGGDGAEPAQATGPRAARNLLVVSLDTTRADHLGCYGYEAAHTPRLDALAERGIRFERAFAQVPLTLPSHASLFTGTYPASNGVRVNDAGGLNSELPTLAEVMRASGLRTGAFIAAWVLDATFGLARGFDHYADDIEMDADGVGVSADRPGAEVVDETLAWLAQERDTPFFAWVHLFDAHAPYNTPAPDGLRFDDPYDAEIAYLDHQVGRVLDWLEQNEQLADTLVVVIGDHGEAFGDRGEEEHGILLYNSTVRVPLIFAGGKLPAGKVVDVPVGLVDVLPTVLELFGARIPSSVQGQSLVPTWSDVSSDPRSYVYSESDYARRSFGWASLRSLTTSEWKYIGGPVPELYDLRESLEDTQDVAAENPDVVAELSRKLERLIEGMPVRQAATVAQDSAALERLASLGYASASEAVDDDDGIERKNPRDMIPVLNDFKEGQRLSERGEAEAALALLEPAVEKSPESSELHGALAFVYYQLGRAKDAQREYELSLRSMADIPWKWCGLGDSLRAQGKLPDATAAYRRALEIDEGCGPAHSRLGVTLAEQGDFAGAERHHRRNLELNPDSASAQTNLAGVLPPLGKVEEALSLLRKCARENPEHAPAYQAQWQILTSLRRPAEALDVLRAATRALPRNPTFALELAWALATVPDETLRNGPEALQLARKLQSSNPSNPRCADVFAAAAAEVGDFSTAVAAAQAAIEAAARAGQGQLANQIRARLANYQAGRPFRAPAGR